MIKAVLDTNVLVSSLLASGPPAVVVDLVADGKIIPFFNDLILQEYREVLSREKFGFSSLQVTRLLNDIARAGIAVESKTAGKLVMLDEDDQVFYDTALQTRSYLVTGNKRHFPKKAFIVSPAQFLSLYQKLLT